MPAAALNIYWHLNPYFYIFTGLYKCLYGVSIFFYMRKNLQRLCRTEQDGYFECIQTLYWTRMWMAELKIWDYVKLDIKHFLYIFFPVGL